MVTAGAANPEGVMVTNCKNAGWKATRTWSPATLCYRCRTAGRSRSFEAAAPCNCIRRQLFESGGNSGSHFSLPGGIVRAAAPRTCILTWDAPGTTRNSGLSSQA